MIRCSREVVRKLPTHSLKVAPPENSVFCKHRENAYLTNNINNYDSQLNIRDWKMRLRENKSCFVGWRGAVVRALLVAGHDEVLSTVQATTLTYTFSFTERKYR